MWNTFNLLSTAFETKSIIGASFWATVMFDTLKGWIVHALNSIIPAQPNPSGLYQKATFPPKWNYLHLQHYTQTLNWKMGQPIFIPEIYFGQPDNFLVVFRSFLNLHSPAVRSLANTGFARKKNLFAFVRRKNAPRPSILPLFLLLIPIIVKIFYDQSKLDVFLIHDIRQKTATCCDRDTKAWCKNWGRLGAILEESVRPSGRS